MGVVSGGEEIGMRWDDRGADGIDGRDPGACEETRSGVDGGAEAGAEGRRGVDVGADGGRRGDDDGAIIVGASPRLGEDSGRFGALGMTAVVSRGESDRGGGEGRPEDAQPACRDEGDPPSREGACIMLTGPGTPEDVGPIIVLLIAGFSQPCCFFCSPGKSVSTSCARRAVTSPGEVRE